MKDTNIIHMNLESLRYRNLTDYLSFYDYVSERIVKEGKTYLIFDELQAVEHWEKAVESFRLDFDVDIYITGSNAYLLSTEFATLLSGRYVEIRMLPLSFKEFLTFYEFEAAVTMDEKFQKYLQFGGMPILREYQFNEVRSNQALEGIYSTVVLRDILQRNSGADQNMLLGYRDVDRGHIIENIVFLELLRRDYHVSIGKVGETEVDFVAEKPNDKLYIQVTESMQTLETRERELRHLKMISDNYEKIVLSMV